MSGIISATNQNRVLDLRSPQTKFNLMRKLQEVKEELHGSSDEETFQADATESFSHNRATHGLNAEFQRMYINEESVEEEEPLNSDGPRSVINEDKERRGEQIASQNVSPQIVWTEDENSLNTSVTGMNPAVTTPPSGILNHHGHSGFQPLQYLQMRNLSTNPGSSPQNPHQPSIELLI